MEMQPFNILATQSISSEPIPRPLNQATTSSTTSSNAHERRVISFKKKHGAHLIAISKRPVESRTRQYIRQPFQVHVAFGSNFHQICCKLGHWARFSSFLF